MTDRIPGSAKDEPRRVVRVLAVIPARGGSKGLPGKNLRLVGGRSLVRRTADAALAALTVDKVVVSSDDEAILAAAGAAGAVPLLRPAEIAGDEASSEAAVLHALDAEPSDPEIVLLLQCTSPFTQPEEIDQLVAALDDPRFDAAVLVAPDHGFLWRSDEQGIGRGINHDERGQRVRRQDLAPQFRETGAGYAMRTAALRKAGTRFCGPVALVEAAGPPIEIDDAADLRLSRAWAAAADRPVPTHETLARIRALVTDFDGVHTDDTVIVDQHGTEHVRCSRRDGMGIDLLRKSGVPVLVLSKEPNPVVSRRAEKLRLPVIQGTDDKLPVLERWAAEQGLGLGEIAFIGNDVNDVACMAAVALSFAPSDAHPSALDAADHVLSLPGGNGALRELADLLIEARHGAAW